MVEEIGEPLRTSLVLASAFSRKVIANVVEWTA